VVDFGLLFGFFGGLILGKKKKKKKKKVKWMNNEIYDRKRKKRV